MSLNTTILKTPLFRFWLTAQVVMGLFFTFACPPFQTPDEFNHFFKINHILEGNFYGEVRMETLSLGGTIPKSAVDIAQPYYKFVWHEDIKHDPDTFRTVLNTPHNRTDKTFAVFPNTARYAPIAYAPQLVVTGIAQWLDVRPVFTVYIGRIANFAFWLACLALTFCILPRYQDLFLYLTLIPGTISIQATLSADVLSNGFLFLMMALFLKFYFEEKPVSRRALLAFWGLSLVSSWAKIVYFPMCLLLWLVPKARFGGQMPKMVQLGVGLLLNLIVIFWWNGKVNHMIYPVAGDYTKTTYHELHETDDIGIFFNVNPELQKQHILHDPLTFAGRFLVKTFDIYNYCNRTYISNAGWESVRVLMPIHVLILVGMLLFFSTRDRFFSRSERWTLVAIGQSLTALFLLSQHLHWDEVGGKISVSHIGKYFIPIFPLFYLAMAGWLKRWRPLFERYYFEKILRGVLVVAYINMVYVTLERFYNW
jgi:uncharacterized membrane protein